MRRRGPENCSAALVMQAELLERRALRSPQAPVDLAGSQLQESLSPEGARIRVLDAAGRSRRLVGDFGK